MVKCFSNNSMLAVLATLLLLVSACGESPFPGPGTEEDNLNVTVSRIDAPTTWTDRNNGVDYIVHKNISVFSELTVEPGVLVIFLEDAGLDIASGGVLKAAGEVSAPIVFTADDNVKGFWQGIVLDSDKNSVLDHCVIEYAGTRRNGKQSDCAVYVTGTASITNSSIHHSGYHGVGLAVNGVHNADIRAFENNILLENEGHPIYAPARLISEMDLASCSFQQNDEQSIAVYINNSNRDLEGDHNWENPKVPFLMTTKVRKPNGIWKIGEGTQFLMGEGTGIHVDFEGVMTINGSASEPVIIKSEQNLPGSWKGIFIETDGQNKFNHLEIYHGGSSPYIDNLSAGNITLGSFVRSPVKLNLSNCLVAESAACGIAVKERDNVEFNETNSSFSGNTKGNMCTD